MLRIEYIPDLRRVRIAARAAFVPLPLAAHAGHDKYSDGERGAGRRTGRTREAALTR